MNLQNYFNYFSRILKVRLSSGMQSNTTKWYSELPLNGHLLLMFLSALQHTIDFSITFIAAVKQSQICDCDTEVLKKTTTLILPYISTFLMHTGSTKNNNHTFSSPRSRIIFFSQYGRPITLFILVITCILWGCSGSPPYFSWSPGRGWNT